MLPKKILRWHPIKIWVDFTGYPSHHFSGCRLNGQLNHLLALNQAKIVPIFNFLTALYRVLN